MKATPSPPLVGRAAERAAIGAALAAVRRGAAAVVTIAGEPGIGKSTLLADLASRATAEGCTVLTARASEYETDLPHGLWTEALDERFVDHADRHGVHRALRDLLERRAARRALAVCLDDVHWADAASVDGLAAVIRRPLAARVLLGLTVRTGRLPAVLRAALADALRDERVTTLELGPLTEGEAAELVGAVAPAIYAQTGGNPFYLEQLARASGKRPAAVGAGALAGDLVPPAVAAALASELLALTAQARRLLDAAAVAGDPFELGLAGAIAELPEAGTLDALDDLLAAALVRPAETPRRFAFRHPVVRHAVYAGTPGGWRLAAHTRAARALERRGAGVVERAHHVEHAAEPGDEAAVDLLTEAARALQSPAPASAAHFHAAALRLLPERPEYRERRARLQARLADAQSAAGDPYAAHATLLDALRTAGEAERLALTAAVANAEWWLDRHADARRRLQVALATLPAQPSADRIRLRLALALTALSAHDLHEAQAQAGDAGHDARAIGDPVFEAAALAAGALARVLDGTSIGLDEAAAALERLTDEQLATRLPSLWMLGRARHALGQFGRALADLDRGAAIAGQTGRANLRLSMTIDSVATLVELGRVPLAVATAEEGLELARLSGIPPALLWARSALASARLAAGDVAGALRAADDATRPEWCLGAALTAAGNPERAVDTLLQAFGGATLTAILPAQRPAAAADLVEAQLAAGNIAGAEQALTQGEAAATRAGTPWAAAVVGIARSHVLLARGRPQEAAAAATEAREAAAGDPVLTAAHALLAEGRARAAAGDRRGAIEALVPAEAALDACGARRRRDEAARELRRLGQRVVRAPGAAANGPLAALTAREREVAELVAAGRSNREVGEQLFLSARTIEAHLRNIFGKLGVRSRVELARAVERASAPGGRSG